MLIAVLFIKTIKYTNMEKIFSVNIKSKMALFGTKNYDYYSNYVVFSVFEFSIKKNNYIVSS